MARDHSKWLLGKQTQKDVATESKHSPRQFRRKTAWCWDAPSLATLVLTREIHHAIIIDGIRVGSSVCLIARTTEFVIGWKWVPYESSRYWSQLIAILPPPAYVVCDGQKGMLHALNILWLETVIQRCRFHAWLNVKTKLTLHPESEAGKQLLAITRDLLQFHGKREARIWKYKLHRWFRKHHCYIEQRTNTHNLMKSKRTWHYTHYRVRSASIANHTRLLMTHYVPATDQTCSYQETQITWRVALILQYERYLKTIGVCLMSIK